MTRLAVDVLGREALSVLICGHGRVTRNPAVASLAAVRQVLVQDIVAISDQREFVGSGPAGGERFDIVVAADLIERFLDPHMAFMKVFGMVADDGVLICSTNIYDSADLERQRHRFGRKQVSHYTPKSLRRLAAAHNQRVDFRLPAPEARTGRRKRYVIFSRSQAVMDAVSDYFGRHRFAPPDESAPRVM